MADKLSLEIVIQTIAKNEGIVASVADVKKLASELEGAAAQGKALDISTGAVATRLRAISTASAPAAAATADVAKVTAQAAVTTSDLSARLSNLKLAGAAANQALGGLAQGGITGLNTAVRGLYTTVTTLAKTGLGAVLLPVLAIAGAAFVAMSRAVDKNRETIKKWGDQGEASAAAVKARLEEVEAASEKTLKAQIAEVEKLDESYKLLTGTIDRARQRVDALSKAELARRLAELDAREQEALEKSPNDSTRAGISKKFTADRTFVRREAAGRELDDQALSATVERSAAQQTIAQAQALIDAAEILARETARAAEEAKASYKAFLAAGGDSLSKDGRASYSDAIGKALAAKRAATNRDEVVTKNGSVISAASARVEDAELAEQLAAKSRERLAAETRAENAALRIAEAKEKEAQIAAQVQPGLSRAVVEGRLAPESGGTITRNGQTISIAPKEQVRPEVAAVASAIAAAQAPQVLILDPIQQSFDKFAKQNQAAHRESQQRLDQLARQLDLQAKQLSAQRPK